MFLWVRLYSSFGKYSDPFTFSTFLRYSLILNWISRFLSSSIYTQYPIITKKKQVLGFFLQLHKKYQIDKYSAPLAAITALSLGYDATSSAHLYLGSFSYSSLQILSSSVRLDGEHRCTAFFRSLQKCSIGFMSGVWLGHSRTFRALSRSHSCVALAVCLGLLSCWKGNICSQSEVPSSLEQVFIKDLSYLCSVHLFLDPDYSPSPYRWKTSPHHDAATTMLHRMDGARFSPDVLQRVSHGLRVLQVPYGKLQMDEWLPSGHSIKKAWLVDYYRDGCPSGKFSHLHRGTLELCQWLSGSSSPLCPRPFSPDCLVWPGGQLLEESWWF